MAGFGQIQCCSVTGTGTMVIASVGQRSTQAPQPVQASRITLWICLAAPMTASVGQTLMHLQQPMQISSATCASCGPLSLTADRWQHVTLVCDGEKIFCYLNGEEKSAVAAKGESLPSVPWTCEAGHADRTPPHVTIISPPGSA